MDDGCLVRQLFSMSCDSTGEDVDELELLLFGEIAELVYVFWFVFVEIFDLLC